MRVGAERAPGDSGDEPAVAPPGRARQDAHEHLARDDAQALGVLNQFAALGDRLNEDFAFRALIVVGLDHDVVGVESQG